MSAVRGILRHELLRRSLLFAAPIVLSTLVGVFSIPLLVASVGASQWGILVVLQSIGQFFAVLVAFGWGATGPSLVAALPRTGRRQFFLDSLIARGVIFVIVLPLAVFVGALITRQSAVDAALSALAYGLPGVGAAWYFVGTNRPVVMFLLDSLPMIVGQICGLLAVVWWPSLTAYLAAMAIASTLVAGASVLYVLTRAQDGPLRWRERTRLRRLYSSQLGGSATMISTSVSQTLPPAIVQIVAPAILPVYAIADRLFKYAIIVLGPALQAVQSWVPEGPMEQTRMRSMRTLQLGGLIGIAGGLCILVLAHPVSYALTLGEAPIPWLAAGLLGAAFAFEALSQVSGLAGLVALGGVKHLAGSAIASALIGLPLFAVLTALWGINGAALAMFVIAAITGGYRTWQVVRLARASAAAEASEHGGATPPE